MSRPLRLRRRLGVTCYWFDGSLVAHPFPDWDPVVVTPLAVEVLSAFDGWRIPSEVATTLTGVDEESLVALVDGLHDCGLLVAENTAEAERDEAISRRWGSWAPEAPFFHYATRAMAYPPPEFEDADNDATASADSAPQPAHVLFTEYADVDRILLSRRPARFDMSYGQILFDRRTCRDFAETPVSLDILSALLATVFGPVDYIDSGLTALMRRTSASGGSRQELEAYLGIRNVAGVPPGFYHYNVLQHSLELLSEGLTSNQITDLCAGQEWAGGMAFFVAMVSDIDRMRSKYSIPRSYRVVLLNAGHLGQTFAMTATALGLGPFQTGAYDDAALARAFGLDESSCIPVYLVGAGYPNPIRSLDPPVADLNTFRRTRLSQTGDRV